MDLGQTKYATLLVLYKLQVKHVNTYSRLFRKTIQAKLEVYHNIRIALRTISYHLKDLVDLGFIETYQRYGRRPNGEFFGKASNRALTGRALHYLKSKSVKVPAFLWKHLKDKAAKIRSKLQTKETPQQGLDQRNGLGFTKLSSSLKPKPP